LRIEGQIEIPRHRKGFLDNMTKIAQLKIKSRIKLMTKNELVHAVAQEAHITKEQASNALDAIWQSIESFLAQGETLTLVGFGTFKASKRKEKQGRNPRTQEVITIPAKVVPVFTAGKTLREAVRG